MERAPSRRGKRRRLESYPALPSGDRVSCLGIHQVLTAAFGRPERFLKILSRPNPRSWLVWGTRVLTVYSAIAFRWLGADGSLPNGYRPSCSCPGSSSPFLTVPATSVPIPGNRLGPGNLRRPLWFQRPLRLKKGVFFQEF